MNNFKISNPFLKKRMVNLPDGTLISIQQYIDEIVLPKLHDAESIKLNNGKEVSLNVFINQYVLTRCINEYNCDFNKFYSDYVNDNLFQFFLKNDIDINGIARMPQSYVYNMNDINPIVTRCGIYNDSIYSEISVSDIIGVFSEPDNYDKKNIANNLDLYFSRFDQKIVSYSNRANSMLNYSRDTIIDGLYNSFRKEPIVVVRLENGKALISENGMHRYHLLKTFYLDELSKAATDGAKDKLKQKYTIPVKIETIDLLKTYSNYLLRLTGAKFSLNKERNGERVQTNNSVFVMNNKKYSLTDQQLIELVRANLDRIDFNSKMLFQYYEEIPSFSAFINFYFPEFTFNKKESRGIKN